MNLLEERYRQILRLLPASYRAEWEDEMVATFMDAAGDVSDEQNPKPRWSEVFSVAALAVRVRLGGVGATPRSVVWGDAVRLAALLGLLVLAATHVVGLLGYLRLYVFGLPPEVGMDYSQVFGPPASAQRLWNVAGSLIGVAWIAAYVALVRGHSRAARFLGVLALAPALVDAGRVFSQGPGFGALAGIPPAAAAAAVVLALSVGFHRDAPPPMRRRRWLAALPLVAAVLLAANLAVLAGGRTIQPLVGTWLATTGLRELLLIGAGVAYLGVHGCVPARRTPSWPLALALLSVPVLVAQVAVAPFLLDAPTPDAAAVMIGRIVAVAVPGLVLAVLGARMIRQVPSSAHGRAAATTGGHP